jgi:hypothetical protein
MERSAIRGSFTADGVFPDFAPLHPGYGLTLPLQGRVQTAEKSLHFLVISRLWG